MSQPKLPPEMLDALHRETFDYFVHEVNPSNGLVRTRPKRARPPALLPWDWPWRPTR